MRIHGRIGHCTLFSIGTILEHIIYEAVTSFRNVLARDAVVDTINSALSSIPYAMSDTLWSPQMRFPIRSGAMNEVPYTKRSHDAKKVDPCPGVISRVCPTSLILLSLDTGYFWSDIPFRIPYRTNVEG